MLKCKQEIAGIEWLAEFFGVQCTVGVQSMIFLPRTLGVTESSQKKWYIIQTEIQMMDRSPQMWGGGLEE